ncbi:methyl-accepting chemotaxis protein [Celeribacter neptunius]|uniref:Methyl-accepting chemotaxis protein n=1 Tax=Celeribacter neptunius TaxID=588602 RepID=A0A1I3UE87_9RHOB|nr:methyl-accepting chemotaxis protein [Celeribacter neptunius]SFJ81033.1 methyl-accepting chemotaxis protein [Celeribacter neptunius]
MNIVKKLPISVKLPLIVIALVLASVSTVSVLESTIGARELKQAANRQLEGLARDRSQRFSEFMQRTQNDIMAAAGRGATAQALSDLSMSWTMMAQYGDTGPGEMLNRAFIDDNPNPVGKRRLLDAPVEAIDDYNYSGLHALYHPEFRALADLFGYYDIYLIDQKGNVVFSVEKKADFASNLLTGPYGNSGLAKAAFVAETLPEGEVAFSDFAAYGPSEGAPAAFMATPIFDAQDQRVGVLAYQLPNDRINAIVSDVSGLGETGDAFLVGPDQILRTDMRFADTPTALERRVEGPAVIAALSGKSGILQSAGADGDMGFTAYAPVNVFGRTWAFVVEKDEAEVTALISDLIYVQIIAALAVIVVTSIIAVLVARGFSKPLTRVRDAMHVVRGGDYHVEIKDIGRGDEIGGIARVLGEFRDDLSEAQQTDRESQFRGAAFQASGSAMLMVEEDMTVLHGNAAITDLFTQYEAEFKAAIENFSADEIAGRPLVELFPQAYRAEIHEVLKEPGRLPHELRFGLGEIRLVIRISAVEDAGGAPIGFVAEWQDATGGYMNAAILASIDTNQVRADFSPDGKLLDGNAPMLKAYAITREHFALMPKLQDAAPELADVYTRVHQGETVFGTFPGPVNPETGEQVMIDGAFSGVKDENGQILRIIMIGKDVTREKRAWADAEAKREAMQAAQQEVVDALRTGLGELAEGDLTTRIESVFSSEYEQLRADFNLACERLQDALGKVVENANLIKGEASEISSAADDLSVRTEKQAATLEETATALDQLTSSVKSAAEGSTHANRLVDTARENAEASGQVVHEAVTAMSEIEQSSLQISKITGVIDDIAFQTNLLALNAGVEAARAGDAGRGFAVVASEVRALAQRSSDAAREINQLISSSGAQVKRGVDLVGHAGEALKGIVESVKEISRNVSEIAASSQEQSVGLAEINTAMNQLDQVTQQNAAMFEQTTAASHALTREAESLTQATARFRTGQASTPPVSARGSVPVAAAAFEATALQPTASEPVAVPKPRPTQAKVAVGQMSAPVSSGDSFDDGWDEF